MIRLILFLVQIALVVGAAIFVADRSGRVSIEWHNSVIETSTFMLVVLIALLVALGVFIVRVFDRIGQLPMYLRTRQRLSQQKKGQQYLSQAVNALAFEKPKRAASLVKRAEKLLGHSQVVDLVKSHVKPAAGEASHEVMVADFSSAYAWREAVLESLKENRVAEARQLVTQFAAKYPDLPMPKKLLLDVRVQEGDWSAALDALDDLRVAHGMPRKDMRQMKAALYAEKARDALTAHKASEAFEWAMQADRQRASWLPAQLQAVAALNMQDRTREAAALISRIWANAAHPQLVEAFVNLRQGKSDLKMAQEAEKIAAKAPDHPASLFLLARAFTRAGLTGQALYNARELVCMEPSRSAYLLLAHIEGDKTKADEALRLAADAPPDAAWVCQSCKTPLAQWQAVCPGCKSFNSLMWATPAHVA